MLLDFDQHSQPPRAPIHEYDDNSSVGSVDSFGSTMGAYNNMRDIPPVGTVETGGGGVISHKTCLEKLPVRSQDVSRIGGGGEGRV